MANETLCTELKTVHVAVKDGKSTALPPEILGFLEKLSTNVE
jgi:acyl-CoA thioesterase FadM